MHYDRYINTVEDWRIDKMTPNDCDVNADDVDKAHKKDLLSTFSMVIRRQWN